MALIKSAEDIRILRIAGQHLKAVIAEAGRKAVPGTTLIDLDAGIHAHILSLGCTPSFLGFDGFPNSSCLSLNAEVVHGIPDDRVLKDGDILGIDVGLWYKSLCVDSASTVAVGTPSPEAAALLEQTKEALKAGIRAIRPFRRVGVISQAIEEVAAKYNLGIVRTLTGHGVGHRIHEDPEVPNWGRSTDGIALRPGMVLAIEPMLTLGGGEVLTKVDGWGVETVDGSLAAQFEHTVLITQRGGEILT
jgi:methionyl aminopeptidase